MAGKVFVFKNKISFGGQTSITVKLQKYIYAPKCNAMTLHIWDEEYKYNACYGTASINIAKGHPLVLKDNQIVLKDNAEYGGLLQALEYAGIVEYTNQTYKSGFNEYYICNITGEFTEENEDESAKQQSNT
jgi:hypothetical protein